MKQFTGAQALVKTLIRYGIRYVFGNPGSSFIPILDTMIGSNDIQFILGLQEATVIGMADGYAKATSTPAVAMVHTIAGLSNSLGGIYNAYISGTPLVVVAGNQDSKVLGRTSFSESPDITGIPRQFVKFSQEIIRADRISEVLGRTLRFSAARPTGPCFLSLSRDLQTDEVEIYEETGGSLTPLAIRPDAKKVKQAAELLLKAEKPVLIAGFDVAKDTAQPEVIQMAELLGCPVLGEEITNFGGLSFPTDHPQYLGSFSPDLEVVEKADLVLAIGKKLFAEFSYSTKSRLPQTAKIIHIHENPWEMGKIHTPSVSLHADTKSGTIDLLESLTQLLEKESLWRQTADRRKQETLAYRTSFRQKIEKQAVEEWDYVPIKPSRLAKEIAKVMGPGMTIVNEATRSTAYLLNHVEFNEPQSLYSSPGGYLGWGLPAAIGIKLALPERKVIAYLGDGASLYTIQALWTATKYNLPVAVVICNNASYLAVKAHLNSLGGNAAKTRTFDGAELFPRVNFVKLAEGFGAKGYAVTDPDNIGPILKEALSIDKVAVVDVVLDSSIPAATR